MFVVVRHRIVTAFSEGLAAQNAPQRQKKCPVRGQSPEAFDRIFRTGRVKTALATEYCRKGILVNADEKDKEVR